MIEPAKQNPYHFRIIAHTNKTCAIYNEKYRMYMFAVDADESPFRIGDRLIAKSPARFFHRGGSNVGTGRSLSVTTAVRPLVSLGYDEVGDFIWKQTPYFADALKSDINRFRDRMKEITNLVSSHPRIMEDYIIDITSPVKVTIFPRVVRAPISVLTPASLRGILPSQTRTRKKKKREEEDMKCCNTALFDVMRYSNRNFP